MRTVGRSRNSDPVTTEHRISADDLATCRRFSAALAAGDADAALTDAHPAIELHRLCDVVRGAPGVRMLAAGPRLTDHTATVHLEDVVPDGIRAVARGRIELRRADTGAVAESRRVTAVLEVRDGLVVRWQAVPPVHPA